VCVRVLRVCVSPLFCVKKSVIYKWKIRFRSIKFWLIQIETKLYDLWLNEDISFWVWFALMFRSFSFLCSDLFMNFLILFLFCLTFVSYSQS
jgi:hypothetical protein